MNIVIYIFIYLFLYGVKIIEIPLSFVIDAISLIYILRKNLIFSFISYKWYELPVNRYFKAKFLKK